MGKLARQVVQRRVFGIDYSKDMIEYSKEENQKLVDQGRIGLIQGVVEKMGFSNDLFDLVTAIETCYFWSNLPGVFREIKRVLKQGGKLLIVSEMIKDGKYEIENAETIAKAHVKLCSIQETEDMLHSAGFIDVKTFKKTNLAGTP